MAEAGVLLVAEDLYAGYVAGVDILNGCDLTLHDGELIGIIGPNGAGKSTLLKAMFGLVPVREGSIRLRGEDITQAKAHRLVELGVGYVPQNNNVFPSLSVQENLEMGSYQRRKDFKDRFEEVCDLFPLLADRRKQRA
ncbi:MAG TPA: ATP-binding cassette domain-containing protein, partial [Acidimicrobiales bacterium]|nr:ATP-binding cassette domain-containing protein [Acidimicrobiales bacterium]